MKLTKEERTAFMARLIPYGMSLLKKAKEFELDWKAMTLEQLSASVTFEEVRIEPTKKGAQYVG